MKSSFASLMVAMGIFSPLLLAQQHNKKYPTSQQDSTAISVYPPSAANSHTTLNSQPKVMTVDEVIRLSKAGLSEDVIIAKIKKRPQPFDPSTEQLVQLKNAQVSDRVIDAMMLVSPSGETADQAPKNQDLNTDDPLVDHEPGVYIYHTVADGTHKLVKLDATTYSHSQSNSPLAPFSSYKTKSVLRSPHAAISAADQNAVFYFYFPKNGVTSRPNDFGAQTFLASTPNEFTLLRFDVNRDSRQTTTMRVSYFGSLHMGTEDKATVPITSTKVRPGVFKVTPNAPLPPGEYCFYSGTYAYKFFDFGITR